MLYQDEKRYQNRRDAGEQLARFLETRYAEPDILVAGIPRGGVEVAYYVALQLQAPLTLIVSKKLSYPGRKELGFGAVAEDNAVYVKQIARDSLTPEVIYEIIEQQTDEVHRRVQLYRKGQPLPDMKGKTVIVVDDGIATGVTLVPVVNLCRKKEAGRIVVAAPVSGSHFDKNLLEADEIEILARPHPFYGVGQVYDSFGDFTDQELLDLLDSFPDQPEES